jgi:hypothetical protein
MKRAAAPVERPPSIFGSANDLVVPAKAGVTARDSPGAYFGASTISI